MEKALVMNWQLLQHNVIKLYPLMTRYRLKTCVKPSFGVASAMPCCCNRCEAGELLRSAFSKETGTQIKPGVGLEACLRDQQRTYRFYYHCKHDTVQQGTCSTLFNLVCTEAKRGLTLCLISAKSQAAHSDRNKTDKSLSYA